MFRKQLLASCIGLGAIGLSACQREAAPPEPQPAASAPAPAAATVAPADPAMFLNQPLVSHIFTADPSAHIFQGRIYIYPSHDIETGVARDAMGGRFDMRDYHVFSMDAVGGDVTDHGNALDIKDVPWATRQMWAPDAAEKNGKYYLFFPAKDKEDVFRIGVAIADGPAGPFKPQPEFIAGTYSIDPSVFQDGGEYYLILGGIRGGQLQRWATGSYKAEDVYPADEQPALMPKIARLNDDLTGLKEELRDVVIQDENGKPLTSGDSARRFFEGPWLHKYDGKYYLSYSTGDTHFIVYATADSVTGPYTYRGKILDPVLGWTNHHSIVEFQGKWYLFYHDSQLSGQTHLRNIKVTELKYRPDGSIEPIDPWTAEGWEQPK